MPQPMMLSARIRLESLKKLVRISSKRARKREESEPSQSVLKANLPEDANTETASATVLEKE